MWGKSFIILFPLLHAWQSCICHETLICYDWLINWLVFSVNVSSIFQLYRGIWYVLVSLKQVYTCIYNIQTLSENIKLIYTSFRNRLEKKGSLFWAVSQPVQINFIFTDNVRILCSSCNAKKVKKTTAKLSEKSWNKLHYNCFQLCLTSVLMLLPFLTVALHESDAKKTLLCSWLNNTEVYLTPFISAQNHTRAG